MNIPPALVLGCNTPHGVGVLSDWIQEHTGVAPDFTLTAWSDLTESSSYSFPEYDDQPFPEMSVNGYGDGSGYGDGDGGGSGAGFCYSYARYVSCLTLNQGCVDGTGYGRNYSGAYADGYYDND